LSEYSGDWEVKILVCCCDGDAAWSVLGGNMLQVTKLLEYTTFSVTVTVSCNELHFQKCNKITYQVT